jgi:hypothetical protein
MIPGRYGESPSFHIPSIGCSTMAATPLRFDGCAPATPEAQQWNGHGTALKPSHEPIVLARKPLEGTVAGNVLKHGVGGLNIEQCRVGTDLIQNGRAGRNGVSTFNKSIGKEPPPTQGRFPANIIHDGSEEVLSHFPTTKQPALLTMIGRRAGIPILSTR